MSMIKWNTNSQRRSECDGQNATARMRQRSWSGARSCAAIGDALCRLVRVVRGARGNRRGCTARVAVPPELQDQDAVRKDEAHCWQCTGSTQVPPSAHRTKGHTQDPPDMGASLTMRPRSTAIWPAAPTAPPARKDECPKVPFFCSRRNASHLQSFRVLNPKPLRHLRHQEAGVVLHTAASGPPCEIV